MKRWRRNSMIAGLLVALTAGGLYEASTHVVRGWLRGEAFYDGRPTSYWREQVDSWVARFDSPAQAETHLRATSMISSTIPMPPPPTLWGKVCVTLRLPALRTDNEIPRILNGGNSADAVWRELEVIPGYGILVDQARREAIFH